MQVFGLPGHITRTGKLACGRDRGYFGISAPSSLRLAAQDVALSRRKQGFESPRERQGFQALGAAIAVLPIAFLRLAGRGCAAVEIGTGARKVKQTAVRRARGRAARGRLLRVPLPRESGVDPGTRSRPAAQGSRDRPSLRFRPRCDPLVRCLTGAGLDRRGACMRLRRRRVIRHIAPFPRMKQTADNSRAAAARHRMRSRQWWTDCELIEPDASIASPTIRGGNGQ